MSRSTRLLVIALSIAPLTGCALFFPPQAPSTATVTVSQRVSEGDESSSPAPTSASASTTGTAAPSGSASGSGAASASGAASSAGDASPSATSASSSSTSTSSIKDDKNTRRLPLSARASYTATPRWKLTVPTEWKALAVDQGGVSRYQREDSCVLTVRRNAGALSAKVANASDAVATTEFMKVNVDAMRKQSTTLAQGRTGHAWVGRTGGPDNTIELATGEVTFVNSESKDLWRTTYAGRAMPASKAEVMIWTACPANVVDPLPALLSQASLGVS